MIFTCRCYGLVLTSQEISTCECNCLVLTPQVISTYGCLVITSVRHRDEDRRKSNWVTSLLPQIVANIKQFRYSTNDHMYIWWMLGIVEFQFHKHPPRVSVSLTFLRLYIHDNCLENNAALTFKKNVTSGFAFKACYVWHVFLIYEYFYVCFYCRTWMEIHMGMSQNEVSFLFRTLPKFWVIFMTKRTPHFLRHTHMRLGYYMFSSALIYNVHI